MPAKFWDAVLPALTVALLSPAAAVCFRNGVPIELIVFGLLVSGYKVPQLLTRLAKGGDSADAAPPDSRDPHEPPPTTAGAAQASAGGKADDGGFSWRAPWRSKSDSDTLSWRSKASTDGGTNSRGGSRRAKPDEQAETHARKEANPRSALVGIKKNSPNMQWRGLINKFTPEKFDKICEQLMATLPTVSGDTPVSSDEYKQVLEDMLGLIFDACSRQHQYTQMYTNLCQKLLDYVRTQKPELDGKSCIWGKCQHIFLHSVLQPPEIPTDLPEDEYMDRKAKLKEKMVGMVKFGGDLVSRGLVPCDGVMQWIHTLLSEKTQEVYSAGAELEQQADALQDKAQEQREVQLELLCAILAGMGSLLSDRNNMSAENRSVIEDVFMQLEQLSMDTTHLSLRIRCLIRDILDLRMAQWKEKEGKLKPGMLLSNKKKDEESEVNSQLRGDAPEFVPGADWNSDRVLGEAEKARWLDPQLLSSLQAVEHHLEVMEDRDSKYERLKRLIKFYNLIQERQLVVVANSSNVGRIAQLIGESFKDVHFRSLDFSTSEPARRSSLKSFELGETAILVMASEVSTRRDFDFGKPCPVLLNFDFPMTLQLYLYRLFKRADSSTHVYTFFSPSDVRHAVPLMVAMDAAGQKIPDALKKLKEQVGSESGGKRDSGSRRNPRGPSKQTSEVLDADDAKGGRAQGKARASPGSWRDDASASGASFSRQERDSVKRRDSGHKMPDSSPSDAQDDGGWQSRHRGANNRRAPGDRGLGGEGTDGDGPSRSERAPWFEDSEPRRTSSTRGDQPVGGRLDGAERSRASVPSSPSTSYGSTAAERGSIRQRRPDPSAEGGNQVGAGDGRRDLSRLTSGGACGDAVPPHDNELGPRPSAGSDKQRDAAQHSGGAPGSRGGEAWRGRLQ